MRYSTVGLATAVLVLLAIVIVGVLNYFVFTVRVALADEQTEIFSGMVAQATGALSVSPPKVQDAVASLRYAHRYYPSGTKQVTGSRLDRIVERTRSLAEMRIIDMLRDVTDEDYGQDAEAWIAAYDDQANTQQRLGR